MSRDWQRRLRFVLCGSSFGDERLRSNNRSCGSILLHDTVPASLSQCHSFLSRCENIQPIRSHMRSASFHHHYRWPGSLHLRSAIHQVSDLGTEPFLSCTAPRLTWRSYFVKAHCIHKFFGMSLCPPLVIHCYGMEPLVCKKKKKKK